MSLALGWLILSGLWSLLVLNALYPPRHVTVLMLPSFFAGWLTGEPWPHHLLAMLLVALAAILFGGLEGALGWGALALTGVNAIGLLVLGRAALATRGLFDEALRALPDFEARSREDSVPSARGRQVMPLALWDGRVERLANLRYAGGRRHKLDLYRSKEGVESAPVVLQIHGGGWIIGHKRQQGRPLLDYLAARGFVCVAINYRLAPFASLPKPLIDVKLALKWIREHVAEYGGDPERIYITGGSAGGHLASLAALTAGDPRYQPGFEDTDTRVAGCLPVYGAYDFTNRFGQRKDWGMQLLLRTLVLRAQSDEVYEEFSPIARVHAEAPPFCVIHGRNDTMVPCEDARHFVEQLRAVSKQPVVHVELPRAQHAFDVFHSLRTEHMLNGMARFMWWVDAPQTEG